MQHYSKRSSLAEKVLFSKKKKKRKEKTKVDDLDLTFLLTLQALQPALFSAAAAREAREAALRAASRFSSLLAAASRFCCSIHGNCSASRTKSQILQPCDPGLTKLEAAPSSWKVHELKFCLHLRKGQGRITCCKVSSNVWCLPSR